MKTKLLNLLTLALLCICGLTSCSKDEPKENIDYGRLDGNLIAVGSTRNVTYTSFIVLGTVDFPKITSEHSYGIVYMEGLQNPYFDYDDKLVYGGHSSQTDTESYYCIDLSVSNSSVDGKFEKKVSNLKPATLYYYRAYVKIGDNTNYSKVMTVTTDNPADEINLATFEASDILALKATMKGGINIGKLQDVNEDQEYGFIYTDAAQMNSAETLSYEYYDHWMANHFETEEVLSKPRKVVVKDNLEGRISNETAGLAPGTTYYYRTYFSWNGKYFYAPEVMSFRTIETSQLTLTMQQVTDATDESATLKASFPYSKVGLEKVRAGFMVSKKYSDPSYFDMKYAQPAAIYGQETDLWYVETFAEKDDYAISVGNLESETAYYVVPFIYLGDVEGKSIYIYGNLANFKTEKQTDGEIEITSGGAYPWRENADGSWTSGNAGINNSTSTLTLSFTPQAGQSLQFTLDVSCENGYDKVRIKGDGWSAEEYTGFVKTICVSPAYEVSRPTTVTIEYIKDGYGSAGSDGATISNITLRRIQTR